MIEQFYDLRPEVLALDRKALDLCRAQFAHVEEIRDYNQLKMLRAFTDCGVEARHFWGSSGYGVWDDSRNKLEEVFARCMGAEAALVRPQFMSGTHTLTVALFGLLRTGDTLLAATGRPYDTLEGVIGIGDAGKGCGTLREFGVNYDECPLLPDFTPDYDLIAEKGAHDVGVGEGVVLDVGADVGRGGEVVAELLGHEVVVALRNGMLDGEGEDEAVDGRLGRGRIGRRSGRLWRYRLLLRRLRQSPQCRGYNKHDKAHRYRNGS